MSPILIGSDLWPFDETLSSSCLSPGSRERVGVRALAQINIDSAHSYTAPPPARRCNRPAPYSISSALRPIFPDAAAPPFRPGAWAAHKPSSHILNYSSPA